MNVGFLNILANLGLYSFQRAQFMQSWDVRLRPLGEAYRKAYLLKHTLLKMPLL